MKKRIRCDNCQTYFEHDTETHMCLIMEEEERQPIQLGKEPAICPRCGHENPIK